MKRLHVFIYDQNPASPEAFLITTVLIIAYELSCSSYAISPSAAIIRNEDLSNLFQRLRGILKMAGYEPKGIRDNEKEIMADLRRIIARAAITEREAQMLHGIISQIEDSLGKKQGSRS
jgi:tRNA C32,U32 (ribose-2'-O)-methylase TrmJ